MINVNKKSWHFKLVSSGFNRVGWEDSNLCKYFWQVVWFAIKFLIVVGTIIGFIVFFLIEWKMTLTIIGFSSFIWLPIVGVSCFRMIGINIEIKNSKQLNLISEYLKEKKEKICPIIKFK